MARLPACRGGRLQLVLAMSGDGECTWWPDRWGSLVLTPCCEEHDRTADHLALFDCVLALAAEHPLALILAPIMFIGVVIGGPLTRRFRRRH